MIQLSQDQQSQKEPNPYDKSLGKLLTAVNVADENGLFKNDKDGNLSKIIQSINSTHESVSKKDSKKALEDFYSACHQFNEAIENSKLSWRFTYEYGGPVIIYFLGLLASMFLVWYFFSDSLLNSTIMWVPTWAFIWGAAGGVLQGFWKLWQHISQRSFRKFWFVYFFLLPLMGGILGALVYIVYYAGFIVATGGTQIATQSLAMLLSALAGFSSWWAVELLNALTDLIKIKKQTS